MSAILYFFSCAGHPPALPSFPTRRSSDLAAHTALGVYYLWRGIEARGGGYARDTADEKMNAMRALLGKAGPELVRSRKRSEEHTSELQSHVNLVCRLLLEKKKPSTRTCIY